MKLCDAELKSFISRTHFSPNALWARDNPVLHYWLANELFVEFSRLLVLIPLRINPNLCDGIQYGRKSLLILLALLPSCGDLVFHFIARYRTKLNFDYQDVHGKTALHYAMILGRYDLFKCLIEHGASAGIQDKSGKTAVDYLNCAEEIIEITLKRIDIHPRRDEYAKRNLVTDQERRHVTLKGKEVQQTKPGIDGILADRTLKLTEYISGKGMNWGTFIGDASEETYDRMLSLAQEIAEAYEVPLDTVFVVRELDESYHQGFMKWLEEQSTQFSGVSVIEKCNMGHQLIASYVSSEIKSKESCIGHH